MNRTTILDQFKNSYRVDSAEPPLSLLVIDSLAIRR